jgi:serine/threonine protein kinase
VYRARPENPGKVKDRPKTDQSNEEGYRVGQIRVAEETKPIQFVAIKRNFVNHRTSFIGALRELDLLIKLNGHPNIVSLLNINFNHPFNEQDLEKSIPLHDANVLTPIPESHFYHEGKKIDNHYVDDRVHFVMEYADSNLFDAIQKNKIPVHHIKDIMLDVIFGLKWIHSNNIIHRDLKPENILLFYPSSQGTSSQGTSGRPIAKLCDFGMSKNYTSRDVQSPGIVTVIYRAPEISIGLSNYDKEIDVWSLGCIFYEMITKVHFIDGNVDSTDESLLKNIIQNHPDPLTETVINTMIRNSTNAFNNSYMQHQFHVHVSGAISKKWERLIQKSRVMQQIQPIFGHLEACIRGMLEIEPSKRLTLDQVLEQPFFQNNNQNNNQNNRDIIQDNLKLLEDLKQCKNKQNCLLVNIPDIYLGERDYMFQIAYRNLQNGFPKRNIFQSIDLYDRWLSYPSRENKEYQIYYATLKNIKICYFTCLYISMKLFNCIHVVDSFGIMFPEYHNDPEAIKLAEKWEMFFIQVVCKYHIYQSSYFEILHTDQDIFNLISYIQYRSKIKPIDIPENETSHLSDLSFTCQRLCELYNISKDIFSKPDNN